MAATDSKTPPAKEPVIDKKNQGRTFEVIVPNGQVGPWLGPITDATGKSTRGMAFTEHEFRRIHPAPRKPKDWDEGDGGWEPASEYYEGLLNRLLNPEPHRPAAIRVATDRTPDVTPLGPESNPPKPYVDPVISQITAGIKEALAPTPATPAEQTK